MLSLVSGWISASSARVRSRSSSSLIVRYSAMGLPPEARYVALTGPRYDRWIDGVSNVTT